MIRNLSGKVLAAVLLSAAVVSTGCNEDGQLRAVQISSGDQLIGGPSAKGKMGDYLLENDRIRVIVAGKGPSYAAGMFGGGVLDIDLQRWRAEDRANSGWDSFMESFPLANLLTPNPDGILKEVGFDNGDGSIQLVSQTGELSIVNDGSDGKAAILRMTGHSDYMFDMLKFLNRELIDALLQNLSFSGMTLTPGLLADFVGNYIPGLNLFALLNRLQIGIDFSTDYILEPGKPWLKMATTIRMSPPYDDIVKKCPPVTGCTLECPNGFAMTELSEPSPDGASTPYLRMCPICECANATADMPTFNETRDFFSVLLGTPADWVRPEWKGGVVAGDFLFFGSESPAFVPGLGYDVDRKIYENMYDGVGTMGSPITVDWIAAKGINVSYAWATVNPFEKHGYDCPKYRLAISRIEREDIDFVTDKLKGSAEFDLASNIGVNDARSRVKTAVIDNKPVYLVTVPVPAEGSRPQAFDDWKKSILDNQGKALAAKFGDKVQIDLIAAHECLPSKLMIPLFSSSATAVLTHFTGDAGLQDDGSGNLVDRSRSFTFTRYLTVGEGDIASALRPVFELRKTPHGELGGVVTQRESGTPLSKVEVFVLEYIQDKDGNDFESFQEYRKAAQEQLRSSGFVTALESDTGIDMSPDGSFAGPVEVGTYYVFAHSPTLGNSQMEKVEITDGGFARVNLSLVPPARIEYRVSDNSGLMIPARLTFMPVELDTGDPLDYWTSFNEPELGDSRYDHGIGLTEHSLNGEGTVTVPAGRYNIYVSHGFEYEVKIIRNYEVSSGEKKALSVQINREVDTTGYVAADLHLHTIFSSDSSLPVDMRLKAIMTEGVEYVTANDHDVVINYEPYLADMGLEGYIKTVPSAETSPLEWGHFNLWPMKWDGRDIPLHDPVPWQAGESMEEIWDAMFSRADGPADATIMQLNHPRDGTMGYFNQIGFKAHSLQRKNGAMMMCSKAVEDAPCNFHLFEIFNGKNLHYLHTPTIGELERYNACFKEIVAATEKGEFGFEANGRGAVCGWMQADPWPDCGELLEDPMPEGLDEAGIAEWATRHDQCVWHKEMREGFAYCDDDAVTLSNCKRMAMESSKLISGRYMLQRTPQEQTLSVNLYDRAEDDDSVTCNENGCPDVGCSLQEVCEACLKPIAADCFKKGGWNAECMVMCRDNCPQEDSRPCSSSQQPLNDWFALLDAGMNVFASGNSDSHKTSAEVGYPRNLIVSSTDKPHALDRDELNRNLKAGRSIVTSGPMVDFEILAEDTGERAGLGGMVQAKKGKLHARIRVQTPSWFNIDTIEIYRNSMLERQIRLNSRPEDIIDFDDVVELARPDVDSWYVVIVKGLSKDSFMTPVYKRSPYGNILIMTVISLGAQAILANFDSLLSNPDIQSLLDLAGLSLDSALSSTEWPDSIPVVPFATTNPIKVDIDGDGRFMGTRTVDADLDGVPDLPPFCSIPCKTDTDCGDNQLCSPRRDTGEKICRIPASAACGYDDPPDGELPAE
ncbi:MAG TPA: hypothetical protein PLC24_09535 [Myxococcota bacterium]|nr:hypothetical protein [Myxococcota bacterium]